MLCASSQSEANHIGRALASAFNCACPPLEVIVVDGGSTDGTAAIAQRAGAKVGAKVDAQPALLLLVPASNI